MRKHLSLSTAIALGSLALLGLNACDPYYYQGSVGGTYSYGDYPAGYASGYGPGWGYGNPTFTTSFFVSTGSPYWGYDPYCRAYYNYTRRCYYDPYLYGYYPVGYRPPILVGVPHPHGYRSGYCPPPVRVTNVTLTNYNQRAERYGRLSQPWSREVRRYDYTRAANPGRGGFDRGGPARPANRYSDPGATRQSAPAPRGSWFGGAERRQAPQTVPRTTAPPRFQAQDPRANRASRGAGLPSQYNVPVTRDDNLGRTPDPAVRRGAVTPPGRPQATPNFQPQLPRQSQPRAAPTAPSAPRTSPQIERRMPDRSAAREAPRRVERPMPMRIEQPAPVAPPAASPAAPQPAPGPAGSGGRPGRSRGREGS